MRKDPPVDRARRPALQRRDHVGARDRRSVVERQARPKHEIDEGMRLRNVLTAADAPADVVQSDRALSKALTLLSFLEETIAQLFPSITFCRCGK